MIAELIISGLTTLFTFMGLKINESIKYKHEAEAHKIELMQLYCPPINQMGVDTSSQMLEIREKDCEALRIYLKTKEKKRKWFPSKKTSHTSSQF